MNIVIVDDDEMITMSLNTILSASEDINVVATGNDGKTAVDLFFEYNPDILLMDIRMPNMDGLEAAKEILSKNNDARILLLTTFSDDEYIIKAINVGAKGYILKQSFENIEPALNAVFNGQTVFGNEIIERIPHLLSEDSTNKSARYKDFDLTEKELGIIELVADGQNNKEIADSLFLSEGTVRNYLSVILEKLELRDRTQLACFYYKELAH